MADALEKHIDDENGALEDIQAQIAVLRELEKVQAAKVSALREAARLRPLPSKTGSSRVVINVRRGKPKGAISQVWRDTLRRLHSTGARQSYEAIAELYSFGTGDNVNMSSVRDRVRAMVKSGLIEGSPHEGFRVTEDAAKRFSFANENGEASASPDTEGVGAPSYEEDPFGDL